MLEVLLTISTTIRFLSSNKCSIFPLFTFSLLSLNINFLNLLIFFSILPLSLCFSLWLSCTHSKFHTVPRRLYSHFGGSTSWMIAYILKIIINLLHLYFFTSRIQPNAILFSLFNIKIQIEKLSFVTFRIQNRCFFLEYSNSVMKLICDILK